MGEDSSGFDEIVDGGSLPGGVPAAGTMTISAFRMDAYEVTVARFRQFWMLGHPAPVSATITYPGGGILWGGPTPLVEPTVTALAMPDADCTWSETVATPSLDAHPIDCVDWYTAQAFCVWDGGRLPTEAEWEYAARGTSLGGLSPERYFPWGNMDPSVTCDIAQWNTCPGDDSRVTKRVGSFAPSGGLYDIAGNVFEWTADWFANYGDAMCWSATRQTDPICNNSATGDRSTRGGSWYEQTAEYLRSSSRFYQAPMNRHDATGFRCARP